MAETRTLDEWLTWQESLHPTTIELGLARVNAVYARLNLARVTHLSIVVGGTNGKGSSVALLDSILREAGYRVGCYTSPHILRYNERIKIAGRELSDDALCTAFARVDAARGDVTLTYFEFGTLAALTLFAESALDVVVLEVGLGGRLDAVNIVDAEVSLVTTIDIDHVEWLGPDREAIGYEKAGIYRPHRPAICGDPEPPQSLLQHARKIGAQLYVLGTDYTYEAQTTTWSWRSAQSVRRGLPHPNLRGRFQLQNAAAVLMALDSIKNQLPVTQDDVRRGLLQVALPGRFQLFTQPRRTIVDVAHNLQGARALAQTLKEQPCTGKTLAVFAMLRDKDIEQVVGVLDGVVERWHCAGLAVPRGLQGVELMQRMSHIPLRGVVMLHSDVVEAYSAACEEAESVDRIVVFGSFYTVAQIMGEGIIAA